VVAAVALVATVASLLFAPGLARAKPPPNPSDGQIGSAQQHKNNLAAEVGQLSAQTAQLTSQLDRLKAEQELAEQNLAYALSKLADAKASAEAANAKVAKAKTHVLQAQQDFVGYIQASYMSGELTGTTGTLLTAHDPNILLEEGALHDYQSSHQLSAIANLQRATVAKSNADAAARRGRGRPDLSHQRGRECHPAGGRRRRRCASPAAAASGRAGGKPDQAPDRPAGAGHSEQPAHDVRRLPAGASAHRGSEGGR